MINTLPVPASELATPYDSEADDYTEELVTAEIRSECGKFRVTCCEDFDCEDAVITCRAYVVSAKNDDPNSRAQWNRINDYFDPIEALESPEMNLCAKKVDTASVSMMRQRRKYWASFYRKGDDA